MDLREAVPIARAPHSRSGVIEKQTDELLEEHVLRKALPLRALPRMSGRATRRRCRLGSSHARCAIRRFAKFATRDVERQSYARRAALPPG